jgi:protein arginine kinase
VQPAHRGAARQAPAGLDQGLYGELGGVFQGGAKARGDLYLLTNEGALGLSEEEFLFRLRHVSKDLLDAERRMREAMITEGKAALEDRVGRALGLAGHAYLAGFVEALGWLSSIRLGADLGLVQRPGISGINEVMLRSQGAHLEVQEGHACEALAVNTARAALLRARFG